jgi:hypothetical protein
MNMFTKVSAYEVRSIEYNGDGSATYHFENARDTPVKPYFVRGIYIHNNRTGKNNTLLTTKTSAGMPARNSNPSIF